MLEAAQIEWAGAPAHQRLSDRVAGDLFRLIVTLELKPGSVLYEHTLMQRLQCGRTPLREALLTLERQLLVRIVPRQATIVTEITLAGSAEIYEALQCIEGPIARLAAARVTPAGLADLQRAAEALHSMTLRPELLPTDLYPVGQLDFGFHETVAQAASNQFLLSAWQSLRGTAMRLMCLSYRRPGAMASLWVEHHRILEALSGRDPGAAERAGQEHIEAGKRRMFDHVSSAPFR